MAVVPVSLVTQWRDEIVKAQLDLPEQARLLVCEHLGDKMHDDAFAVSLQPATQPARVLSNWWLPVSISARQLL